MDNQRLRILYLKDIFESKSDECHGLSIRDLQFELENHNISVERKTLYRDIDILRAYGMDIIKENRGKNVVYYIGERYFELPELKLLVDAVQSSKFITEKKSKKLIKKIESLSGDYGGKELNRQVYVTGRVKSENENIYYTVNSIHDAINGNKKIKFQYYEWFGEKEKRLRRDGECYSVSPWMLVWDNQNYYLIGYDDRSKEIRHYRVDKMINTYVSDEKRDGKALFKDFNIADYSKSTFGMFNGIKTNVEICVENELTGVFFDRFGTDIQTSKYDESHTLIEVEVNVSDQFIGWIIALGKGVKIINPADVIEKIKRTLFSRKEIYSKK